MGKARLNPAQEKAKIMSNLEVETDEEKRQELLQQLKKWEVSLMEENRQLRVPILDCVCWPLELDGKKANGSECSFTTCERD